MQASSSPSSEQHSQLAEEGGCGGGGETSDSKHKGSLQMVIRQGCF